MPLQQARQRRAEARELLAQGVDPSAERKATRQAQRVDGVTFETMAREWYAYRIHHTPPNSCAG